MKGKKPRQKPKSSSKHTISFRVPSETREALEEIARCARCSVDQVVAVILATRIVTERKAHEAKP